MKSFLINEADQYVDLMPADGKTYWSDDVRDTRAKAFFNEDGTVSIVNYYSVAGFNWPYVYTQPEVAIDLQLTRWLYFTYESTNYFNVVLDYTYNGTAYSVKPQTVDYPAAGSAATYCVDLHAVTGLSGGTIVLKQCKFYTVGDYEGYVKLHNFGLASSEAAARTYASGGTGTYMDGYTALMVEYMGSRKDGLSGAEGVEFFVDAVIDCGMDFDEEPHQLKAKTDYGFMLYIPDAVMANLAQRPARGDLVDATFLANGLGSYSGGTTAAGHTLTFYENPTNALQYATAADVNATVKLFNYGADVSRDGFNFWNGFWGWGGNAESVDGKGVEDGKLRNPVPLNTLSNAGYPQLDDGDGGVYALDYLFDGTQTGADGSSALVSSMKNGGGLFQMDEDGYYYYDSMQNAAYYDEAADKFVLMEDLIVRPWYNSNKGDDFKNGYIFSDYADVSGSATSYGNFLPFNKITQNNITVDGGVYYNAQQTGRQDADGNWIYTDIHTADEAYTAYRKAAGSLERYGLTNTAADKVVAGNKAMFRDAYDQIVEVNGGDVMSARLEDQLDLGFGMTVDFDFYQPQGGKFNGEDMEFDFLGDDDVFVYVGIWNGTEYEYRLVLDIGGTYYLYDTDYKYMGYANSAATHGYTLYAPAEIYNSMVSILPAALEGNVWSSTLPDGATLVPLDPNQANSAGTTITAGGKTFTKGQYFAPVPAGSALLSHNVITDEQYQNALMTVQSVDAEGKVSVSAGVSASIEAIRTNFQQTCPAAGLDMAGKILEKNRIAGRDQIVILFTDGVPTVSLSADREYGISSNAGVKETYWSGMSGAKDAVNLANDLKGLGIQIYTIGTSGLTATVPVDPNNNDDGASVTSITGNRFLDYVSSNYQGVSCVHTVHTKGYDTANTGDDDNQVLAVSALSFQQTRGDTVTEITDANPAVQSADIYTKTAADGDFSVAFGEIMKTVSYPNVTLGTEAVLQDTLSEYFDLNAVNPEDIEVYVAPYTGMDADGIHTFGTPVPASEAGFNIGVSFADDGSHSNAVINVSGFSYSEHYVRQDPETKELLGYKLIVKVPVKARAGFWGGNNVPTNKYTTAIYDGSGKEVQPFPMPEANVPVAPAVVAGDKTVYYGGDVNASELLSHVTVGGEDVTVGTDGSLTPAQDWMDDYATLTWTAGSTVPGYTTVDNKDADVYPYSVTLSPIHDGSENLSQNPSNIAGTVVTNRIASDDANVYVLVPVITWRDVTINLGDAVGSAFFEEKDFVSLEWVDQDTLGAPVLPPVDVAPELSYLYSASGKPIKDTPVDVHVISSYGDEDITNHVIYRWEDCTNSIHMTNRDQIFEHSGSEVSREFYIHVNGEDALVSDKTVSTVPDTDLFELTMEGYVTGSISELHITKPADIVLVLDHSGSMHTPVGATEVLHSPKEDPNNPGVFIDPGEIYTGAGQLTKAQLSTEKGIHRGYYVAQSTSSKWWFLMEYDAAAGKWIGYSIPSTDSDTLYQVPVMKVDMGTYSRYKVTINVSWAFWLDHGQNGGNGSYNFYLDAIRIYNPADDGVKTDENGNVTDTTIRDAYEADGEADPVYCELRDLLIQANTFDQLGNDEIVAGAIFIDGNTALSGEEGGSYGSVQEENKTFAVSEYINYGPNNELYLAPNQGVTFTLGSVAAGDRVHIAMKSVGDFGGQNDGIGDNEGGVSLEIFGVDADGKEVYLNGQSRERKTLNTATDLYYDITELAGTTVVIRNVGSAGIASITNIKTTNNPEPLMLTVSRNTVALALAALNEGEPAPVEPAEGAISLKYATATFEDQIKLNVYFDTRVDAQEMGLITFSGDVSDGTLDNAENRISGAVACGDGSYRVSTAGIAVKNMGDTIRMRVYARLADGSVVYSKPVSYSPKTYAMSILAGDASASMKALAVAMLNYGAAAQRYFGYRTDSLANAGLTAQQLALVQPYNGDMMAPVTKPDASKVGSFAANGGFAQKYPTVSFEGAFAINYYFTPSRTPAGDLTLYYWTGEDYEAAGVLSVDNASGILTVTDGMAQVSGIAAKDMDSTVYVAAVYEAEGVRYCSGVLAYSIGAYCAAQASAGNALAEAAAVYGFYAKSHFGA